MDSPIFIGEDMNSRVGGLNQISKDINLLNNNISYVR